REGITAVLSRFGHEVIAAVGVATALIEAVRAGRPDIAVTDVLQQPRISDPGLVGGCITGRCLERPAGAVRSQRVHDEGLVP
ncbi:MAG TPA: hypothetical protein VNW94_12020, partial [Streptosporangiaceae bacterium]|nr:hypothetical protein [Streptosporangiaceae bacterium]